MRAMGLHWKHVSPDGLQSGINYTYSKKKFTSPNSEPTCLHADTRSPSISAFQATPDQRPDQRAQLDDAMVRDCMKAKGYKIDAEPR